MAWFSSKKAGGSSTGLGTRERLPRPFVFYSQHRPGSIGIGDAPPQAQDKLGCKPAGCWGLEEGQGSPGLLQVLSVITFPFLQGTGCPKDFHKLFFHWTLLLGTGVEEGYGYCCIIKMRFKKGEMAGIKILHQNGNVERVVYTHPQETKQTRDKKLSIPDDILQGGCEQRLLVWVSAY